MKKVVLFLLLLAGVTQAKADDYAYLVFQNADGTQKSVSVEGLTITFENGLLKATSSNDSQELTLADLSKMFFSSEAVVTDINLQTSPAARLVSVYSTSGVLMGTYDNVATAQSQLPRGIYIVKTQEKSQKITVK